MKLFKTIDIVSTRSFGLYSAHLLQLLWQKPEADFEGLENKTNRQNMSVARVWLFPNVRAYKCNNFVLIYCICCHHVSKVKKG